MSKVPFPTPNEKMMVIGETIGSPVPPWWQRLVWWWLRITGSDITWWLRWLFERKERTGDRTIIVIPRGTYQWRVG